MHVFGDLMLYAACYSQRMNPLRRHASTIRTISDERIGGAWRSVDDATWALAVLTDVPSEGSQDVREEY
jgi:hypothetical protein